MAQRRFLMLGAMNLVLLVYRIVCMDATELTLVVPVLVERQLGNDTVHFSSESARNIMSCDTDDKVTYLVDDRRCVSNQELLNGCKFTNASVGSITFQNHDSVGVYFSERQQNNTMTLLIATGTNSSSMTVIPYRVHHHGVNSCHIDSLEVYRGRKKVIKISHDGFSINKNGSIQIDEADAMYNIDEFKGELYRMNVTCYDDEDLERGSGCPFLKIIGVSNVEKAKFGGMVSGTVQAQNPRTKTDESDPARITVIDIVTYSISAVAGILLLFFSVILICLACCYCKCTRCTKTKGSNRRERKTPQTADVIPSKLKRELDLSYLISNTHSLKEATSSERPPLTTGY